MTARIGTWFIGARGSVATTATVGALGIAAGAADHTGCVSELPAVAVAGLPDLDTLVFGGHDVAETPLRKRAEQLAASGVVPESVVRAVASELDEVDARIRPGIGAPGFEAHETTQRVAIDRVRADLRAFAEENQLSQVVVVDVSSTEPLADAAVADLTLDELEAQLDAGAAPLSPSSLYAYAAFTEGFPVVAFTPSPGPALRANAELAERVGVPWGGSDGKTGETLLKTALAPMFATRALEVKAWASYNMLGGGDGRTLSDPNAVRSKTATKSRGLEKILGHPVEGPIHIDYIADHGDWKTAWDHISFQGFLGTRMNLQFTWTGCDSSLAAPLVLDLVRLSARAQQVGETGPLPALGFFFKDPAGSDEHNLFAQWIALIDWCERLGSVDAPA